MAVRSAEIWTYRLVAGKYINIYADSQNGFKWISIQNEAASTANGTLLGTMTALVAVDGTTAASVSSAVTNLEPGAPATVLNDVYEYKQLTITAPTGCNINIIAGT
jgi:hypothetical protein